MKKTIRLSESDLHRIVSESVDDVIRESYGMTKDTYRNSYQIDEFNENISNLYKSINDARYYMGQILHGSSDSWPDKVRVLKRHGFYKSEGKMREAYKLLNKIAGLVGSVQNDITGEYKNIEDVNNKYSYPPERSEQADYSGFPGWGG